jgi:hypothetical protein
MKSLTKKSAISIFLYGFSILLCIITIISCKKTDLSERKVPFYPLTTNFQIPKNFKSDNIFLKYEGKLISFYNSNIEDYEKVFQINRNEYFTKIMCGPDKILDYESKNNSFYFRFNTNTQKMIFFDVYIDNISVINGIKVGLDISTLIKKLPGGFLTTNKDEYYYLTTFDNFYTGTGYSFYLKDGKINSIRVGEVAFGM